LAFGSVLVVVFSILLVNTITEKTPLIFLKLGEKTTGEIDCIFSPGDNGVYNDEDYSFLNNGGQFLNYTQIHALSPEDNFAPRKLFTSSSVSAEVENVAKSVNVGLTLIKTDLEKSIELGVEYPYGPL
jgi:hypothetical protein